MKSSLQNYLPVVIPFLKAINCSDINLQNISIIASAFSSRVTQVFGFEIPLMPYRHSIDFGFPVNAQSASIISLMDTISRHLSVSSQMEEKASREILLSFLQKRNDPTHFFSTGITDMWLEYDIPEQPITVPPFPILFFTFPWQQEKKENHRSLTMLHINSILTEFKNIDYTAAQQLINHQLPNFLNKTGLRVYNIGIMPSRYYAGLRLSLVKISQFPFNPLRQLTNCHHSIVKAEECFTRLAKYCDYSGLTLDFSDSITGPIGLEWAYKLNRSQPSKILIEGMLDQLIEMGLCLLDFKKPILDLIGVSQSENSFEWPENLKTAEYFFSSAYRPVFNRRISHFKINIYPDGIPKAKLYWEIRLLWIPMSHYQLLTKKKV